MKKWLAMFGVMGIFYTSTVNAANTPLWPELENFFNNNLKQLVIAEWSPSGNSTQGSSSLESGTHSLGVALPANALITSSYMVIRTAFTKAGNNGNAAKVAFQCEDANNISPAISVSAVGNSNGNFPVGTVVGLQQYPTSSLSVSSSTVGMLGGIAASCPVQAVVSGDDLTAGRVLLYIEYTVLR